MRAPLDLQVLSPAEDWKVIANAATLKVEKTDLQGFQNLVNEEEDGADQEYWLHSFEQCPPISSYIYNMCAGQFEELDYEAPSKVPMRVFLRDSKKDNLDA